MKQLLKFTLNLLLISAFFLLATACTENESIVDPTGTSDIEQLQKLIDNDDIIQSFEPNYNEEEAMDLLFPGLAKAIFPVRVGQKMKLIDRNETFDIQNDTAYGEVIRTYEGTLKIAASYEEFAPGDSNVVDTLIEKNFITTITRSIVFVKATNNIIPEREWRIYKMSLPNGGTDTENIKIIKLTIILPDGNEIIVDNPNEYYLTREPGLRDQLPIISRGENVTIRVEIKSAYEEDDFVTLTHGGRRDDRHGGRRDDGHDDPRDDEHGDLRDDRNHRSKRKFELISSELDGSYYKKVYENVWEANRFPGAKHAIINAMPKQVVFDDETEVETNGWGIPYIVK